MSKLFSIGFPQRISSIISLFSLISLLFSVSSQTIGKKICQTKECLAAAKYFKESINFNADPCDNFYKYACGNWSRSSDRSESIIPSRDTENSLEILDFLKQKNRNNEPEAVHDARKLFSLCLSENAYKNDLEQIETTLQKIGIPVNSLYSNEIENYDYTTSLAKAARLTGANLYLHLEVLPNLYNQSSDTISLTVQNSNDFPARKSSNSRTDEQNDKYEVIKRMCRNTTSPSCKKLLFLLNSAENSTTEEIAERKFENYEIDTESNSILNSLLPVKYALKDLQTLTDNIAVEVNSTIPTLNWTSYIEELFIDKDNVTLDLNDLNKVQITIGDLDSVKEMMKYIHQRQNIKTIAYELSREVIYTLLPYVDSANKTEQDCGKMTAELFSWAVSYMYTTKEKYIKAKTEIRAMFEHFREAFKQLIQHASWMDEMTEQRALKKLQWMRSYIAYPSILANASWLDESYKDVLITDNFYDSVLSLTRRRRSKKLRGPRDDDWFTPPNLVNAEYRQETNSIYILAGILGFPLYNSGLDALDYGVIGSIVGREMAHGFDNNGRGYNEEGDTEDWWQPKTADLYRKKAQCFVQAYRNYSGASNVFKSRPKDFIRRKLGKDLSDNLGFKVSLLAYRKCVSVSKEEPSFPQFENFTHEQLLTLGYANVWCENPYSSNFSPTQEVERSSAEFRVNGVLQNSKEFSEIWKCSKGSKMNPSDDKCAIW